MLENPTDAIIAIDEAQRIVAFSQGGERIFGYARTEVLGRPLEILLPAGIADAHREYVRQFMSSPDPARRMWPGRVVPARRKDGSEFAAECSVSRWAAGGRVVATAIVRDVSDPARAATERAITERTAFEELLARRAAELAALNEAGQALSRLAGPQEILERIYSAVGRVLDNRNLYVALADEARRQLTFPIYTIDGAQRSPAARPFGTGITEYIVRTARPLWIPRDVAGTLQALTIDAIGREARSYLGVPMIAGDRVLGVIAIQDYEQEDVYTAEHRELLTTFAAQAAIAIENARLFEEAQRQIERLQALRDIDAAITGAADARLTMGIVLDKVTANLRVDAAALLVYNAATQSLEFLAGRGFRSSALQHTRLRPGQGYAGRTALERTPISIPDLRQGSGDLDRARALEHEGFVAYHAVPLVAKGQVNGVLEIFHRSPLAPDKEWMDFLVTLAGQAAVALDSAAMFEHLQRANADLILAYDTTLEGWVRALDLRDKESEGHTQRVTDLTVRLARAMGMTDEQLVHVRRGALVHDIGKMGVPDSILLKPEPLTDEEWMIVKQHPLCAYDLLSPIAYLRPALPIPHAHHERWDGNGYPRGLKGEEIPLEARIFAVADAWDALTSDHLGRPRRSADEARAYLREQAGTQFDPKIVAAFLSLGSG